MDPLTRPVKPVRRRKTRRPLSEEIRGMYWFLSIFLLVLGCATIVGYLYLNSQKSAKGYMLKQLQLDYESLSSENRELDHQVIDAQSFNEIEEKVQVDDMEDPAPDEVTYSQDSDYAQNTER